VGSGHRTSEGISARELARYYKDGVQYLGYRGSQNAGKIMRLASYGSHREEYAQKFDELVEIGKGTYDLSAITQLFEESKEFLESHFGERHIYQEEFEERHKDFAYHFQAKLEEIVTNLVQYHIREQGVHNLALAGGVAMNCKLNYEILQMDTVDSLFIQPAANDSGICLGAALEAYRNDTVASQIWSSTTCTTDLATRPRTLRPFWPSTEWTMTNLLTSVG